MQDETLSQAVIRRECQNCGEDCGHAIRTAEDQAHLEHLSRRAKTLTTENGALRDQFRGAVSQRDRYREALLEARKAAVNQNISSYSACRTIVEVVGAALGGDTE